MSEITPPFTSRLLTFCGISAQTWKKPITTSAVGPLQMTGPVNLHFMPHYRRSLWWRRLHPLRHCLPSSRTRAKITSWERGLTAALWWAEKHYVNAPQIKAGWIKEKRWTCVKAAAAARSQGGWRSWTAGLCDMCRHPRESTAKCALTLPLQEIHNLCEWREGQTLTKMK